MLNFESARVGDLITLQGITQKGKNVVSRDGQLWTIDKIWYIVGFSTERGPWAFIKPTDANKQVKLRSARWVNLRLDKNFRID